MTTEEKAHELVTKFSSITYWVGGEGFVSIGIESGKKAAIISIDETIDAITELDNKLIEWEGASIGGAQYLQDVKKYIESM